MSILKDGNNMNQKTHYQTLCRECCGTGTKHGQGKEYCSECKGKGVITDKISKYSDDLPTKKCSTCMGLGTVNIGQNSCKDCKGRGYKYV